MNRKKVIGIIKRVFPLAVFAALFSSSYVQHRKLDPTATFGDFLMDIAPFAGGGIVILTGLGLVLWFEQKMLLTELNKRRAGVAPPNGLGGLIQVYPLRVAVTGSLIAAAAVLIWLQSWVAVPVFCAAFLAAIHVARLAGLEPADDPAAAHNRKAP